MLKIKQPYPGSGAALDAGCSCPVMDNGRGRGYMGQTGVFIVQQDCPLHGLTEEQIKQAKEKQDARDREKAGAENS